MSRAKTAQKPICAGQIWRSTDKHARSAFVVGDVYKKSYPNGDTAERVMGLLITGPDAVNSHERDLDSRSLVNMFPVLIFDPEQSATDEEDK